MFFFKKDMKLVFLYVLDELIFNLSLSAWLAQVLLSRLEYFLFFFLFKEEKNKDDDNKSFSRRHTFCWALRDKNTSASLAKTAGEGERSAH